MAEVQAEIAENANREIIDVTLVDTEQEVPKKSSIEQASQQPDQEPVFDDPQQGDLFNAEQEELNRAAAAVNGGPGF